MPKGKPTKTTDIMTLLEGGIEMTLVRHVDGRWEEKESERWRKCNEATSNILDTWVRIGRIRIGSDGLAVWK